MRVLFWNTHKNESINTIICELVVENNISIVILAEYVANDTELINLLGLYGIKMTQYITTGCDRIKIFGTVKNVKPGLQSSHASMQIINDADIMCCVHLQSQAYPDHDERRKITINQIVTDIRSTETALNTNNTIIVGDFNINPYDAACVGASNLHGIPIYSETIKKSRKVAGQEFYMFYNPMWNFLGDFSYPYGTYYYNGSNTCNTYWHIYDQVIIRPSLKKRFVNESLKIITETKTRYLVNNDGHPDRDISDHLPIIFEIKEN